MQPDAIPIEPVRSFALLKGEDVEVLFGAGYRVRGTERVELVRRTACIATADVRLGEQTALFLDAGARARLDRGDLKLRGPKGVLPAPTPKPIPARLIMPPGLLSAWNLSEDQQTTVAIGGIAVRVQVGMGKSAVLQVDHTLPLAAGADPDATARWVPNIRWEIDVDAASRTGEDNLVTSRVITENDVRRARMLRKRIRIDPGQIITPAARTLATELGILD